MNGLTLLAKIAGQLVAIAAAKIETVIDLADIIPAPRSNAGLVGIAAVRSRIVTVVDPRAAFGDCQGTESRRALVVQHDDHLFAILMDSVLDIISIADDAMTGSISVHPVWMKYSTRTLDTPHGLALLVDPVVLLDVASPMARAA